VTTVSVAICTYNRCGSLGAALDSVRAQVHPVHEIVVVHGPCTDATVELLAGQPDLVVRSVDVRNLSRSRNVGFEACSSELVALLDDDAVADPHWLSALVPCFADPGLAALGGPVLRGDGVGVQARSSAVNCFGQVVLSDRAVPGIGRPGGWWVTYPTGTNAVFCRRAVHEVGGFDEFITYFHDETELCRRLVDRGWRSTTIDRGVVHHGMLPGTVRPAGGAPDRVPLVRSTAYVAFRHGARRRGTAAAQAAVEAYAAEQTALATIEQPERAVAAAQLFAEAVASAEAAAALPPATPLGALPMGADGDHVRAPTVAGRPGGHVGLVCRHYLTDPTSGIPRSYRQLASSLCRLGHVVRVIAEAPDGRPAVVVDGPVTLHLRPRHAGADAARWWSEAQAGVEEAHARHPLDAVVGPNWDAEALEVMRAGAVPVVTTLHTTLAQITALDARFDPGAPEIAALLAAEREVVAGATLVLAATAAICADAAAAGTAPDPRRCATVGRGFADGPVRSALSARPTVVVVGRCEPRKGSDVLLAAWPEVARRTGARLDLVGRSWLEADPGGLGLAEAIGRLEADGALRRRGGLDDAAIAALVTQAWAVAVPSRYESFGLVAAEALRAGVPVVAGDVGGLREVIGTDGAAGVLIAPDDPEQLAKGLLGVLADPSRNLDMGTAARRRFEERFTESAFDAAVAAALEPVLARRGATGTA
jgi:hypothetical protein